MDEQERDLFNKLSKDREENAHVLSKQSMLGVQESVVEKYSDQAHFVYELLQNADDVKATTAKFLLTPNSLRYIHNGKRRFSISDPDNEKEDSVSGILGDINSITSIGNSNKTKASIGKFGVGFKAVFQYTKTPHIYDDNFLFKITDFIVPKMIDDDIPGRAEGETMFLLPFDTAKRSPEIAYSEIANRLEHLLYPQLFLSHLETISFRIGDKKGCYKKTIKEKSLFDDVTAEFIVLTTEVNSVLTEECLWLFSRTDEDYIVIDEASMIPLVNIIYPLYKKTPQAFIIAGDPFQIQPITAVDLWKDENIYSIVHLDSFQNPDTIPHKYKIKNLFVQYRSIPEIGRIFSLFSYNGILEHNRTSESRVPLNLGDDWNIKPLTILKFPVSKYESVYRCKRLQHSSPYQIYSSLFVYEYVCFLSKLIADKNPGKEFKIGIIAPYRAQADLIEKLMASRKKQETVDVQVGTIHGFQGDECDIIFSIFNTPPIISRSPDMFLNNRNIINVSISRARDYLFIVMPDDKTENVSDLYRVKQVERLVKQSDSWAEMLTPEIEQMMFGDSNYLENNAFSTSHQNVNVYGLPEKIYEIRTEENAVDIQVHNPIRI